MLHIGGVEEDGQGGEECQGPDHGVAPHLMGWAGGSTMVGRRRRTGTCRPRIVSRELRCSGKSTRSLNAEDCLALKVEVLDRPGAFFFLRAQA